MDATLGAQFLLWEFATAVAGRLIGINPFDQPDVESAKEAARAMLEGTGAAPVPAFVDGPVAVFATEGLVAEGVDNLADAVDALLGRLDPERGYLAVMAYLDRLGDAELAGVRESLAHLTGRPVTFGWGPRFLHSTGQYHKGGPADRRLPAGHRRAERGPGGPRPTVHLRRVHRGAGDRATPRCSPDTGGPCSGCT